MRYESSSRASDEQSSNQPQHHHRILFSRNNTYTSEYSAGWGGGGGGILGDEVYDDNSISSGYNYQPINPLAHNKNGLHSSQSTQPHPQQIQQQQRLLDEKDESIQSLINFNKSDSQYPSQHLLNEFFFSSSSPTILFPFGSMKFMSWNYLFFCLSFSLSCSPVICILIYSPAVIGNEIGALGNGCFYLSYAILTLFFGKMIIYSLGCVKSFLLSHLCTFVYVLSFLYYSHSNFHHRGHQIQRILFYTLYFLCTSLGGMAQGLNWMAHSKYFSKSCQMLITSMNTQEIENMNRKLSFQFATIYFIILIGIFIACTLVIGNPGDISHSLWFIVIPSYLTIFSISWIIYSFLDNYGDIGGIAEGGGIYPMMRKPFQEFRSIIFAVRSLPSLMKLKLCLLLPYHIAWGFCTTYWIYYILGVIVREEQGLRYISVAAVVDLTASLIYTKFSNYLASKFSQSLSIFLGNISMITFGSLLLVTSNESLGKNKRIIGYLILHGISRSVYESNMKAVIADTFMDYETSLFINLANTSKTISCGVAYLIYALIIHQRILYAEVVVSLSLVALIGYLWNLTLPSSNHIRQDHMASESESSCGGNPSGTTFSGGGPSTIVTAGTTIGGGGTVDELLIPRLSSTSSLNSEMLYVPEYF